MMLVSSVSLKTMKNTGTAKTLTIVTDYGKLPTSSTGMKWVLLGLLKCQDRDDACKRADNGRENCVQETDRGSTKGWTILDQIRYYKMGNKQGLDEVRN